MSVGVIVLVASACLLATNNFLAYALATASSSLTKSQNLSFTVGNEKLEPQELPEFLHPYHSRSFELTEVTLSDPSLKCNRGISYGSLDHQVLDVWSTSAPSTSDDDDDGDRTSLAPVVVFLHGGGWDWGYKEYVGFCSRNVCGDDGQAIMVAPSYRVGKGESQAWPQSRDDILEVLHWVKNNVAEHGGDPTKIIIAGHSAGGHLAACVGLDPPLLKSSGLDPNVIKALFLISCPLGIRAEDFFLALSKRKWLWKISGPIAKLLYRRVVLKVLRPVVGNASDTDMASMLNAANDASPLCRVKELQKQGLDVDQEIPSVHYFYANQKDFPICHPQVKELRYILTDSKVQVW
eukprot:CAMPEP_0204651302 /NCGR_PEP_ID=MMETSP0718-20130828/13009_1 /ASSEMBLY_ACC=CAM_ASM_000674 /TAXON_ID=230516 /ORGANISM="Chaetoceros curvisetus" /LENGTH=349 /DNA_ID=CAMNT_0051674993 /DNA_START=71 /DNA_END=1117 /DNA_ORIENTATION=+